MSKKKKIKRIALVTGANQGTGFEICKRLAQSDDGLTVLLTGVIVQKTRCCQTVGLQRV